MDIRRADGAVLPLMTPFGTDKVFRFSAKQIPFDPPFGTQRRRPRYPKERELISAVGARTDIAVKGHNFRC
jgi:hypothetical protein